MGDFQITTDEIVFFKAGWFKLNGTIVFTWIAMTVLVAVSWYVKKKLSHGISIPRLQNLLEVFVESIQKQIGDVSGQDPSRFIAFIGTLFLLIASATLLGVIPGYTPPTASLSTTAALATCVFLAVPVFGIRQLGFSKYVSQYLKPTWLMLPFNVIGEISRTLALAVRLYGNMMSGAVIATVLLTFVPLFVPIAMQLLGLITGMVQAYIFAILAMVYIASATAAGTATKLNKQNTMNSTEEKI
ncbi:F0F1 ATP synthase subunit A [Pirellulaceae bacterium]|jgi:F-type H+-transporting ATPase subunit a|nr:F0F1 ATP synthase subunit A [Pirellulaceae bacterium]MDB4631868.1 F0F1 ATP synthase subunit A [bacterium]